MLENWEVFISLTRQMQSSRNLLCTRGKSWKFRCQHPGHARSGEESTRRLVELLVRARQNTHSSLKPTNLRESVRKELYIKIMKTTLQEKESIHWTITILCISLFLSQAMKTPDAKAAVAKERNSWKDWHGSWRKSETKEVMRWCKVLLPWWIFFQKF